MSKSFSHVVFKMIREIAVGLTAGSIVSGSSLTAIRMTDCDKAGDAIGNAQIIDASTAVLALESDDDEGGFIICSSISSSRRARSSMICVL
jgi:hypothetical protein